MEKDYKKLCEEYEKRFGIGEFDLSKNGYEVYLDILRQQIEFLKSFKIKSGISSDEKSKAIEYKNAKDLWEGLPKMIQSVGQLKIELKIVEEEKKNIYKPISSKEIANGTEDV